MTRKLLFTEEELWRAFEYVSGDLNEQDAEDFEQQMLTDNSLCEAVAEAVRLSVDVAACTDTAEQRLFVQQTESRQASPDSRSVTAATVVTICCCLALTALLAVFVSKETSVPIAKTGGRIQAANLDAELLVDVWVESVAADAVAETEHSDDFSSDLDVPDWMLAALTLADVAGREDSDMPVEGLMPDDSDVF